MPNHGPDSLDLRDGNAVAQALQDAAEANRNDPARCGATIHLPPRGLLWMTGDLHDHALHFRRLVYLADLDADSDHHLILHEVIHGPHLVNGMDLSIRMLARVADLKRRYPRQVHLLLSNHELAQMIGTGILKDARNVIESFQEGVDFLYPDTAPAICDALETYVKSLPLAVRTPSGILCSHSLPSPGMMARFDPSVLDRELVAEDWLAGGSAHAMAWGRHQTAAQLKELGLTWDIHHFLCGHQPAEMGVEPQHPMMTILASNHEHGHALPIELDANPAALDSHRLLDQAVPLASVIMPD